MRANRRTFIRCASLAAAGNVLGLRPFGTLNALAQGTTDYKALVCIFLYGGNDANNTIIPFDTSGYNSYATTRGPLAIAHDGRFDILRTDLDRVLGGLGRRCRRRARI